MLLRLSELYTSVQGEGPSSGLPTQFVRFAGCNLRCPGWPCDTPYAIDPAIWRHESERLSASALLNKTPVWPTNLCLTGGEPLIQPESALHEYVEMAIERGHTVEVFTNGTRPIPTWAYGTVKFMMDWKLPGSGEYEVIDSAIRIANVQKLHWTDGVKFVVKDERDLDCALADYKFLMDYDVICQFWITPVWGIDMTQRIVEFVLSERLPWKLSLQTHKYIWPAEARGV